MKKAVIPVLSLLTGIILGAGVVEQVKRKKIAKVKESSERYLSLFCMMDQWVKVKQERKNLTSYFVKYGYKKIAIYGMGRVGRTLFDELRDTEITVLYGIDRRADSLYTDIDLFSIDDSLDEVDAIVVTPITFYDEIEKQLSEKMDCPIISLEDILYEV